MNYKSIPDKITENVICEMTNNKSYYPIVSDFQVDSELKYRLILYSNIESHSKLLLQSIISEDLYMVLIPFTPTLSDVIIDYLSNRILKLFKDKKHE